MLRLILLEVNVVVFLLLLLPLTLSSRPSLPSPTALLIVDMQHCFSPAGSLPVPGFQSALPVINRLRSLPLFSHVFLTQDWHPPAHIGFVTQHSGMRPFDSVLLTYDHAGRVCDRSALGELSVPCSSSSSSSASVPAAVAYRHVNQTLWPVHCVMDTPSSAFHPQLQMSATDIIIRKGSSPHIDSYSALYDVLSSSPTALPATLSELSVRTVYIVGVALDVCVFFTAMDARRLGYEVVVVRDATGAIGDGEEEMRRMREAGVTLLDSWQVDGYLEAADTEASAEPAAAGAGGRAAFPQVSLR
jgi:nicotinamidase/pyrazinamidase